MCRARGLWRTTRHTDKRADRLPADQSGKRVASWTGKSPDTPDMHDLLLTCDGRPREDVTTMLRVKRSGGI